jgi:polyferredoxin
MRAMADTNTIRETAAALRKRFRIRAKKLLRLRHWIQLAFLPVWLAPIAALRGVPSCVFHCYACPLASASCPVGLAANAAAVHVWPLMAIGVIVAAGALFGSLICGWACPFGFFQDIVGRIPTPKLRLPSWTGYGRYVVLFVLVIAGPILWGAGKDNLLFICNLCPAGALEAGVPRIAMGQVPLSAMLTVKYAILAFLLVSLLFYHRFWCKVLCPLGGVLAHFNRISVFYIHFDRDLCGECNTCRSRCSIGLQVEKATNTPDCIRCLECTECGALQPARGPFRLASGENLPAVNVHETDDDSSD